MVLVVRKPTWCAVATTSSHCEVESLSGHIMARMLSSRISAAVPGRLPRPVFVWVVGGGGGVCEEGRVDSVCA